MALDRYILTVEGLVIMGVSADQIATIETAMSAGASHVTFTCDGGIRLRLAHTSIGWIPDPENESRPGDAA